MFLIQGIIQFSIICFGVLRFLIVGSSFQHIINMWLPQIGNIHSPSFSHVMAVTCFNFRRDRNAVHVLLMSKPK
jgi:hypothetical protein